jgi:SNF2 family DNA or RNA helicase
MRVRLWVPEGSRFLFSKTPFEMKDRIKAVPGGRWAPEPKCWVFPVSPASAEALWEACTGCEVEVDETVLGLLKEAARLRDGQALKLADDHELSDLPGPTPAWLHQKRAFAWARERRGAMLAMDMGTGKSRTATGLLDEWGVQLALIVCPRSVQAVWPNQFALHSARPWRVVVPPGKASVAARAKLVMSQLGGALSAKEPCAIVVNYEATIREPMKSLLVELADKFKGGLALVCDESHRVKAPGGQQALMAAQLGRRASRVLLLTGTPMPHSPLDIYAQYRVMDTGIFGTSFNRFRSRYAVMGGYEGKQVVGYQNDEELARRFGEAAFVVKKSEAGLDLPPVLHEQRRFVLGKQCAAAYAALDEDFAIGVGEGTVTAANALVKLLRLQQLTSGYVGDDEGVEREISTEKIDLLDDVLQDVPIGEPLVVFARFKHDLRAIGELCERQGRRVGFISGQFKPGHLSYALNEHSQMRSDIDVAVVQLQSGGVGIDLSRAALAVYFSLDFSLGNYEQSLARLDRPGQTRSVTYLHLIAEGTKDEVVYQALQERKNVVEAVIAAARASFREDGPSSRAA